MKNTKPEFKKRIELLLKHFDMRIEQAIREEKRFSETDAIANAAMWDGIRMGLEEAKISVQQILLKDNTEAEQ